MIIFSLLHNSEYIDKLDFIDLKGVELSRYKLKNTTFTDNIEETEILLENLKNEMNCWDAKNLATECIHTWPADAL